VAGLVIKPRARIFHGHDWVYASDVQKSFGNPLPGDVISLKDFRDRPLGSAIYNPASQIIARRFSRRRQALDVPFFVRRLTRALEYRSRLVEAGVVTPAWQRVVWSESDGLPGVVIDRYESHLVLQTLTLAMDQRKEMIVGAMKEVLAPASIVERNDAPVRVAEGLSPVTGMLDGLPPTPFRVQTGYGSFSVDLLGGQKTGLYLDQFENYAYVARLARGRRVLDCFCNQGGFALAALTGGALSAEGVDSSASALSAARENAVASGFRESASFTEANVFDFLKTAGNAASTGAPMAPSFDYIILDPPSFTRSKGALSDALRGYKEIHLRSLKRLGRGGLLTTFTCSHHVNRDEFMNVIIEAAVDARKTLRQIAIHSQRADHPILPAIPETEYLKGFTFEIIAAW
jgi:23S rRNA (cytosine1962-C5)-methyltransferase